MESTSRCGTALAFHDTTFDALDRDGQIWLRANQIGLALHYKNPELSIAKLYRGNAAEFTDRMTAIVKLPTAGGEQDARIFSLRGAHLLGMFARTARAAEFRRWVLDVLDQQARQPAPAAEPTTFAPGQLLPEARRKLLQVADKLPEAQHRELLDDHDLMDQLAQGYLLWSLQSHRWLVGFDEMGRQIIAPVPSGASVMTYADVAKRLADGEAPLRDVAAIAEAAVRRLQGAVVRALPSSQTRPG